MSSIHVTASKNSKHYSSSKRIQEFNRLNEELEGIRMQPHTLKKTNNNILVESEYNTMQGHSRSAMSKHNNNVNSSNMQTLNYVEPYFGMGSEYNALALSSYQSPALQKKTKGFVDFDLQQFRPDISMSNAHEKRFDPYNYFPHNLSNNKPVRKVDFDKNIARDNKIYEGTKCSDSLF